MMSQFVTSMCQMTVMSVDYDTMPICGKREKCYRRGERSAKWLPDFSIDLAPQTKSSRLSDITSLIDCWATRPPVKGIEVRACWLKFYDLKRGSNGSGADFKKVVCWKGTIRPIARWHASRNSFLKQEYFLKRSYGTLWGNGPLN